MAEGIGRPLIAVTGPDHGGRAPRLLVHLGLLMAGGRGVQLTPAQPDSPASYQGVVVTGGHDIEPVLYAQESQVTPRYDPQRDAFESRIIDDALARDLPILGICRGAQLLNVRLGGSLFQELRSRRKHTSNRWTIFPLKTLLVETGTRLHTMMGRPRAKINSLHNQAIDRLGEGLTVSGRDLDDIVQGIEDTDHLFRIGVQWHPEFLLYLRRQRAIFRALVGAARTAEG